jgi:hypothetical protein
LGATGQLTAGALAPYKFVLRTRLFSAKASSFAAPTPKFFPRYAE